jgi:hypothetical protein
LYLKKFLVSEPCMEKSLQQSQPLLS